MRSKQDVAVLRDGLRGAASCGAAVMMEREKEVKGATCALRDAADEQITLRVIIEPDKRSPGYDYGPLLDGGASHDVGLAVGCPGAHVQGKDGGSEQLTSDVVDGTGRKQLSVSARLSVAVDGRDPSFKAPTAANATCKGLRLLPGQVAGHGTIVTPTAFDGIIWKPLTYEGIVAYHLLWKLDMYRPFLRFTVPFLGFVYLTTAKEGHMADGAAAALPLADAEDAATLTGSCSSSIAPRVGGETGDVESSSVSSLGSGSGDSETNPGSVAADAARRVEAGGQAKLDNMMACLGNVTYELDKPCILDLKMGRRQHGRFAMEYKREGMKKKVKVTSSEKMGMRFSGCVKHHRDTGEEMVRSKQALKTLMDEASMVDGLRWFLDDCATPSADGNEVSFASVWDKVSGSTESSGADAHMSPQDLGRVRRIKWRAGVILRQLIDYRDIMVKMRGMRMWSSSILITFDAAWDSTTEETFCAGQPSCMYGRSPRSGPCSGESRPSLGHDASVGDRVVRSQCSSPSQSIGMLAYRACTSNHRNRTRAESCSSVLHGSAQILPCHVDEKRVLGQGASLSSHGGGGSPWVPARGSDVPKVFRQFVAMDQKKDAIVCGGTHCREWHGASGHSYVRGGRSRSRSRSQSRPPSRSNSGSHGERTAGRGHDHDKKRPVVSDDVIAKGIQYLSRFKFDAEAVSKAFASEWRWTGVSRKKATPPAGAGDNQKHSNHDASNEESPQSATNRSDGDLSVAVNGRGVRAMHYEWLTQYATDLDAYSWARVRCPRVFMIDVARTDFSHHYGVDADYLCGVDTLIAVVKRIAEG